jgi:hypothetical protein
MARITPPGTERGGRDLEREVGLRAGFTVTVSPVRGLEVQERRIKAEWISRSIIMTRLTGMPWAIGLVFLGDIPTAGGALIPCRVWVGGSIIRAVCCWTYIYIYIDR